MNRVDEPDNTANAERFIGTPKEEDVDEGLR